MQNDQFQGWLRLGWVLINQTAEMVDQSGVQSSVLVESLPDSLQAFKLHEAKDLISLCEDLDVLEKWYSDNRKGIKKAIEERAAVLVKADTPESVSVVSEPEPVPEVKPKDEILPGVDEVFGEIEG